MRAIISGGGTAGHINPAIAIAGKIKKTDRKSEILFVGTEHGLEKKLVPKAGYKIKYIDVRGLKRRLTAENIKILGIAFRAYKDSLKIIDEFKPDIVIGTGGYVCAPVLYAACRRKIPTLLHEQNVPPGLAVKLMAPRVDVTAISFEETRGLLKKAKRIELCGNPIRDGILKIKPQKTERPQVMVSGGSLGAGKINEALLELLTLDGQDYYDICAATGERYYDDFMRELSKRAVSLDKHKKIVPYIHNMDEVLASSALAVTRAGAITVSELCAIGKPAILIPSPNVAHDHQRTNARFMEKNGAAVVIEEKDLSGVRLAEVIDDLLHDKERLRKMSVSGSEIGIRNATDSIYALIEELLA